MSKLDNGFFSIVSKLTLFWNKIGCSLIPSAQTEISSPILHPNVFFGMHDNSKNFDLMYLQPNVLSKEIRDSRNLSKNYSFLRFQTILKSNINNPQNLFLDSLKEVGFDLTNNDISFRNESFDSFVFSVKADGYRVYLDETPIAIFYYLESIGDSCYDNIPVIISYNLDNITLLLQDSHSVWDINWDKNIPYSNIMLDIEDDNYNFIKNNSTNKDLLDFFDIHIKMANKLLSKNTPISAYIYALKAKYCLDILNYRGHITYKNKINYNKIIKEVVDLSYKIFLTNKNNKNE